jgi:hypothetical protein
MQGFGKCPKFKIYIYFRSYCFSTVMEKEWFGTSILSLPFERNVAFGFHTGPGITLQVGFRISSAPNRC